MLLENIICMEIIHDFAATSSLVTWRSSIQSLFNLLAPQ